MRRLPFVCLMTLPTLSLLVAAEGCEDDAAPGGTFTFDAASFDVSRPTPTDAAAPDVDAALEAPDAARPSCRGAFGSPRLVEGLSGPMQEESATFSPDELSVVFSRSGDGGTLLWEGSRSQLDASFGSESLLSVNAPPQVNLHPTLTADGLRLYFQRSPGPYIGQLFTSTRSPGGSFATPTRLEPFDASPYVHEPHVRPDGQALYVVVGDGAGYSIWRASVTDAGLGAFASVEGLNGHANQGYPVVSADERVAFWAADIGGGNYEIFTATRASTDAPFTGETQLTTLGSSAQEYPVWLSPDHCRLYFASSRDREGGAKDYDIYVSDRAP